MYVCVCVCVCVCETESLCSIAEINTTLSLNYTSVKSKQKLVFNPYVHLSLLNLRK